MLAFWDEHQDTARVLISTHSLDLGRDDYIKLMEAIDGWRRIIRMVTDAERIPGADAYEGYFKALREIGWLEESSTS